MPDRGDGTPVVSRRQLLAAALGAAALACQPAGTAPRPQRTGADPTAALPRGRGTPAASPAPPRPRRLPPPYPFTLGVASGDPLPDGVVLWTRLVPRPLEGPALPRQAVPVHWQVAEDERFARVVRSGTVVAHRRWAHSVHVEVDGLRPHRWYWYRFAADGHLSPVGRTRTTPAPGEQVGSLTLAVASCQRREEGYYAAYRHMARADPDLVLFLGDYIYETLLAGQVRSFPGHEAVTLEDYRARHARYRTDADLQRAHAASPWVALLDDHDVDDQHASVRPKDDQSRRAFARRRAAAYQAFYEHLPLRRSSMPRGPSIPLYRRVAYGALATISVLDVRQYRDPPPCGPGFDPRCPAALDPALTLTGPRQERWLLRGLTRSTARWNVIAQQLYMNEFVFPKPGRDRYNLDKWDGYPAARRRLLEFLAQRRPSNPLVLGGDVHAHMAADLALDGAAPVTAELVGTSISSTKPNDERFRRALGANPHVQHYDGSRRGYVLCTVTPQRWHAAMLVVDDATKPRSPVSVQRAFVVEDGRPGLQPP